MSAQSSAQGALAWGDRCHHPAQFEAANCKLGQLALVFAIADIYVAEIDLQVSERVSAMFLEMDISALRNIC